MITHIRQISLDLDRIKQIALVNNKPLTEYTA